MCSYNFCFKIQGRGTSKECVNSFSCTFQMRHAVKELLRKSWIDRDAATGRIQGELQRFKQRPFPVGKLVHQKVSLAPSLKNVEVLLVFFMIHITISLMLFYYYWHYLHWHRQFKLKNECAQ